jgi:hypothetical protein
MTEKKLLLITFDYELFLGERSGSVQDCLISPTNKLMKILEKQNLKSYFFIDTAYLIRLKEAARDHPSAREDLESITAQLVQMVKYGHEIHPHIHPHWKDAVYDAKQNEWSLQNRRYYSFASLLTEQQAYLFDQSIATVRLILDIAKCDQPLDSYRAGGWTIQPFEYFRPLFIQYGIKYEWSVLPGKYQISDAHNFDFRNAPEHNPVYTFDLDPCKIDQKGPFKELTISSFSMNPYEKWLDFKISGLLQRLGQRPAFKGNTVSSIVREQGDNQCKAGFRREIASFEGLNQFRIRKYLSDIRTKEYVHFISHPKMLTNFEFKMIDRFLDKLNRDSKIQTNFRELLA